jgi:electron transport complex protein RnfA
MFTRLLLVIVSAVFVNNFVLGRFLGVCPFLRASRNIKAASGMSAAVAFVMTLSSAATWLLFTYALAPFGLEYLRTVTFILVIVGLAQVGERVIFRRVPAFCGKLGVDLPFITANCAVLGAGILSIEKQYNLLEATVFGFGAACGFGLVLLVFSGLRERLELSDVPAPLRGAAIGLVTVGLLSLAFMGFTRLVKP